MLGTTEQIDEIKSISNNVLAVRVGYRWGFVDSCYKPLSKVVYDYISVDNDKVWVRYKGCKSFVSIDLLPFKYDFIYDFNILPNGEKWAKVINDNKCGAIDSASNEIIPCKYDAIKDYKRALWVTESQIDETIMHGIYSYNGEVVSECVYMNFANPIVKKRVGEQILLGILDDDSREIVPCEYNSIEPATSNTNFFRENKVTSDNEIFILSKDGSKFLYSTKNGLITTPYRDINQKSKNSDGYYYNREVKDIYYCYRGTHLNEYLQQSKSNDNSSELPSNALSSRYLDIFHFDELLVTCNLDECTVESRVNNDLFICKSVINGKYGLLDKNGYRIPFIYEQMDVYSGMQIIKALTNIVYEEYQDYKGTHKRVVEEILDVINLNGNYIIQGKTYKDINLSKPDYLNILEVTENDSITLYDFKKGFIESSRRYKKIITNQHHDQGYAEVYSHNGKCGIINNYGLEIVPCIYDAIKKYQDEFFIATNNGEKYSFYTIYGKKLEYTFIGTPSWKFALVSNTYTPSKYKLSERYYCQDIRCLKNVGIIDLKGNEIFECRYNYDDIRIIDKNTIHINNLVYSIKNGVIDNELILGEGITYGVPSYTFSKTKNYKQIEPLKNNYAVACNYQDKWGFLDKNGNVAIPFIYDYVWEMRDDGTAAVKKNNKYGIVSSTGETILATEYDFCGPNNNPIKPVYPVYYNGITLVIRDGKYGFLNKKYIEIVPCKYPGFSHNGNFHNLGYLIVSNNDKVGLIQLNNPHNYIVDCIYYETSLILHKDSNQTPIYISASNDDCSVLLDCNSDQVLRFSGHKVDRIVENYAILKSLTGKKERCSLISISNNEMIPSFNYDGIGGCDKKGYLQVMKDGKWGLYNLMSQNETIPCLYYEDSKTYWGNINMPYYNFENNLATIKINEKYGFIDINNNIVIECQYDDVRPFKQGYAAINENNNWGFINDNGNKIIDGLEDCLNFSEGLAAVKINGKWGYINTRGKLSIPCRFEKAAAFSDGLAAVAFEVRWGYINKHNKTIIPFQYQFANSFTEGIAFVGVRSGSGQISKDGEIVDWKQYRIDYYDDTGYERDTWGAMTEGMYGDYSGGDVDYDILGF